MKKDVLGGGQPCGLVAGRTSLSIQKVFDCKWHYALGLGRI
jgi:hypothetical protein